MESEINEAILSTAERRSRGRKMKKYAKKIARARARSMKRPVTPEKIEKRAQKAAIKLVRAKVAGPKGKSYKDLSPSEKVAIDKKVEKKKGLVARLAKKLKPKIKKADMERRASKNESFEVRSPAKVYKAIMEHDDSITCLEEAINKMDTAREMVDMILESNPKMKISDAVESVWEEMDMGITLDETITTYERRK